jgi:hypothetical protein
MSEISELLGSPAWWFSTIGVAIVVNLISAFLFELVKQSKFAISAQRAVFVLAIAHGGIIVLASVGVAIGTDRFLESAPYVVAGGFMAWLVVQIAARGHSNWSLAMILTSMVLLVHGKPEFPWIEQPLAKLGMQYFFAAFSGMVFVALPLKIWLAWKELRS